MWKTISGSGWVFEFWWIEILNTTRRAVYGGGGGGGADCITKMGINTESHPYYCPHLALCDFCLFPKLRGCRYEIIEEMKEAVTKVVDTHTQEDFHGAFQTLLEQYQKCIAAGGDCTITKTAHAKKVWKHI